MPKDPASGSGSGPNGSASGSGASGSGKSGFTPKGKALGSDVNDYVTAVTTIANSLNSAPWTDLATRLKSSYDGTNALNAMPNGFERLVGNLNLTAKDRANFNKIKTITAKCTSQILITINNSQLSCIGACDVLTNPINLTFKPASVFLNFYFSFGCTKDSVFNYATFTLAADANTLYTTFQYKGPKGTFDSNGRILDKAKGCPPGSQSKLKSNKDGDCANASMVDKCKSDLDKRCGNVDFNSLMRVPKTAYPSACDYLSQGLDRADENFVRSCFNFLTMFFRKGTMNLDPTNLQNTDAILENSTSTTTSLRFLQTVSSATIVPVLQDVTASDQSFSSVTLTAGDISVDGSTSSQVGATADGLTQINNFTASPAATTNSTQFISVSILLLAILSFFI
jgi:hypothetical protein